MLHNSSNFFPSNRAAVLFTALARHTRSKQEPTKLRRRELTMDSVVHSPLLGSVQGRMHLSEPLVQDGSMVVGIFKGQ